MRRRGLWSPKQRTDDACAGSYAVTGFYADARYYAGTGYYADARYYACTGYYADAGFYAGAQRC
jgi:hypothetical protein